MLSDALVKKYFYLFSINTCSNSIMAQNGNKRTLTAVRRKCVAEYNYTKNK
jgi:hypothetical protein